MKVFDLKKHKKEIINNYYSDEEIRDSLRISKRAKLNWIEEVNHFIYKARLGQWKKDEELMRKIGW